MSKKLFSSAQRRYETLNEQLQSELDALNHSIKILNLYPSIKKIDEAEQLSLLAEVLAKFNQKIQEILPANITFKPLTADYADKIDQPELDELPNG